MNNTHNQKMEKRNWIQRSLHWSAGAFSMLLLITATSAFADDKALMTIPVDSTAFAFSPGNWTGDAGRGGKLYRQTWNSYAYFSVKWETKNPKPIAKLLFDTSAYNKKFTSPRIAYCIDGAWTINVSCKKEIPIENLKRAGKHELFVCVTFSREIERWGAPGKSGRNVIRITGLQVNNNSNPLPNAKNEKWAMIIGDSITEGAGTSPLSPYSFLLGEALRIQNYEYCINACGWSGWLNRGDNPPGDVPGYYVISGSKDGKGGTYHEDKSRWNKIDGNNHSLLDNKGRISANGQVGQEPSLIFINYGTNDILHRSNKSDTCASMVQCLTALRKSAPKASIVMLIPFGQYYSKEIRNAVESHKKTHPDDKKIHVIDLGPGVAKALSVRKGALGGLHPNDRGHANFAVKIIPRLMRILALDKQL